MEKIIDDDGLGRIVLHRNPRAKYYSFRIRDGQVCGTIPQRGNEREILALIEKQREKLMRMLHHSPERQRWDESTDLQTHTFRVHIFRTSRSNFYLNLTDGVLHIACPEDTDFNSGQVQLLLQSFFEKALRREALRTLPARLHVLAARHAFHYTGVTIRNARSKWGSCSSQKHINLSLSLMLLPGHLIDYVLLHELCHTVEMNHSERFWQLMNKVTGGQVQALRRELKGRQII